MAVCLTVDPASHERKRGEHLEGTGGQSRLWSWAGHCHGVLVLQDVLWSLMTCISEQSTRETPTQHHLSRPPWALIPSYFWIVCERLKSGLLGHSMQQHQRTIWLRSMADTACGWGDAASVCTCPELAEVCAEMVTTEVVQVKGRIGEIKVMHKI